MNVRSRWALLWTSVGAAIGCPATGGVPLSAQPSPSAAAQPVRTSTADASTRFVRIPDALGLSHNSVYALAQDTSGFIWAGTADGLNRFDGYRFEVHRHDPRDSSSVSSNLVWDLLVDRHGSLWVLTSHGVDRYIAEKDRFARYEIPGPTRETAPQSRLLETNEGDIWVANAEQLLRYDRALDRFGPYGNAIPGSGPITALGEDGGGEVWVARQGPPVMLVAVESGRVIEVEGVQWVSTMRGGSAEELILGPAARGTPGGPAIVWPEGLGLVWDITLDAGGTYWVAAGTGLYSIDSVGRAQRHVLDPTGSSYLFDYGRSVFVDATGAIWVGTHGGLFRHDPYAKPFDHLGGDPANVAELSGSAVSAVRTDSAGDVWVGTLGQGLNRIRADGSIDRYTHRPGDPSSLPHDRVWSLHVSAGGSIWAGTQAGLAELKPTTGRFRTHPLPATSTATSVRRIEACGDGRLWVAAGGALNRYDPTTQVWETFVPGGPDGSGPSQAQLSAIVVTESAVWIGAGGTTLDRFDPASERFNSIELVSGEGRPLTGEGIWDAAVDRHGALWLGTGSGLGRYDPLEERFTLFTTADGLPGSVVYSVQVDANGRIWLGTNQGLSRFDPRAPPGTGFRNFDLGDGIGSLEFNRAAAFQTVDGELLFGGMNGLTRFVPTEIAENPLAPPVVLTDISTASGERVRRHVPGGVTRLDLTHRESTISFEFAALSYTNPAQNLYEYRLEPIETQWVPAGPTRLARYPYLRPGDYRFVVRGSNNDGVWNEAGTWFEFTISPPFWETAWFRGLALVLIGLCLYAAYRYRVSQLLAVERVRMRVAGDLHDELSSSLSGIALMSEMAARDSGLDGSARRRLARISETARGMGHDVRDMVWIVDTGHDSLEDLELKMKDAAAELLGGHEYRFEARLDGAVSKLPLEFRRHAYMAFKEMLHNVVRHAEATAVDITACADDGSFDLTVADDGIGLTASEDSTRRPGKSPFQSLQRRAIELGGELDVDSSPGRGTRVTLRVPIP